MKIITEKNYRNETNKIQYINGRVFQKLKYERKQKNKDVSQEIYLWIKKKKKTLNIHAARE